MRYLCRRPGRFLPFPVAASLLVWMVGCQPPSPPPATGKATTSEQKAAEKTQQKPAPRQGPLGAKAVLEKMVAAYHKAATYRALGSVRLTEQQGGKEVVDRQWPCSVIMVRPNKIQVKAYDAQVVSDGKQYRATIEYLPGQVLTLAAPAKLTLSTLDSDGILAAALAAGPGHMLIQLGLLLDDDPLKWMLKDAEEPQLAEPNEIDGQDCYRVKIERPEGTLILWIDQESFVLRRMIPPLNFLRQRLEEEAKVPLDSLSLVVELTGAKLDPKVDPELFNFDLPKDTVAVKYFLPPPALLLGKKGAGHEVRRSGRQARHHGVAGRQDRGAVFLEDAARGQRLVRPEPPARSGTALREVQGQPSRGFSGGRR